MVDGNSLIPSCWWRWREVYLKGGLLFMYLQVCEVEEKGRNTSMRSLVLPRGVGQGGPRPPFAIYFYYEIVSNMF
jgi:hypothetical protein